MTTRRTILTTDGTLLLRKLIDDGNARPVSDRAITEEWFFAEELPTARYVFEFFRRHGSLPTLATVQSQCNVLLPSDVPEPLTYYIDQVEARLIGVGLRNTFQQVERDIAARNPRAALDAARQAVLSLSTRALSRDLVGFHESLERVLQDYEMRSRSSGMVGIPTGWPTLDRQTGGLQGGDNIAVIGRIRIGKTHVLLKLAETAYRAGRRVLFVSFEMPILQMARSFLSTTLQIANEQLRFGRLSYLSEPRVRREILRMQVEPERVHLLMAGLTSTVPHIHAVVRELHPELLILDGGGMIQPSHGGWKSRWEQASATAQELRMLSLQENIPIVTSYHFNREVKTNSRRGTLENIGLTDEVGKLSTLVLGIFRRTQSTDDDQPVSDDEQVPIGEPILVRVLKGREGERGSFEINFNFQTCDFSEVPRIPVPEHYADSDE